MAVIRAGVAGAGVKFGSADLRPIRYQYLSKPLILSGTQLYGVGEGVQ